MAAPAGLTGGSVPEPLTGESVPEPLTGESVPEPLTGESVPEPLTGESVPEPTEPELPDPDPAGEAGTESALGVADAEPDPGPDPGPDEAASAAGTGPARRTSPLAVAAVILGLIALAGVAVGILAVVTHGFRAKSVVQYRVAAVFSLRPGDCLNSAPNGADATLRSCSAPHDAEVFATFSLAPSSWPGDAAVQSRASNGCQGRIAGYLNPQLADAGLAQEYFYPDQAAWQAGVRTVVCEVSASTGQLTGSVRAPG
jgi:hypothetical protein